MKKDYVEIEFKDVLHITWKRKLLILFPTLLCAGAAVIVSLFLPHEWSVNVLIEPSKYMVSIREGKFNKVLFENPENITAKIKQGVYTQHIYPSPRLNVKNPVNTDLIIVSLKTQNVEEGKKILNSLYDQLKLDIDRTAEIKLNSINTQIKKKEITISVVEKEKMASEKKLAIIKKRNQEIDKEITAAQTRIRSFEDGQKQYMERTKGSAVDTLSWLFYTSEVQQSMRYLGNQKELLGQKKIEAENIQLDLVKNNEQIEQLRNEIKNLDNQREQIDLSKLVKKPTASSRPVSPKTKLNAVIGGLLGFIFSLIFVFVFESYKKNKANI